jgi:hypothetical protein
MTKSHSTAPVPAASKGWLLAVPPNASGKTPDRAMAEVAAVGMVGNARTVVAFGTPTFGELSLTDCANVLTETAQGLNGGDMKAAIGLLAAQAVALNAMFGELARVGQANMFSAPDYADRYLRLAFKAQSQTRATLETLAAIKNPPVVFARQANINNGGQQQVNNGTAPNQGAAPVEACASAHAGESVSEPNELLEDRRHGIEKVDARATTGTGRKNQSLAPVGAVNGAEKRGGQGRGGA